MYSGRLHSIFATLFFLCQFLEPVMSTSYTLAKEYVGSTFFNDWTFFDHYDNLTNGDAIYVSASNAASAGLAYVDPSTNHAIIKVDNTSNVALGQKRNTVRITTNDRYAVGTMWVADILHIPYGCSVWPAWWSQASIWPEGGEINTLEVVNLATRNQMSLHTRPGCAVVGAIQSASSITNSSDCSSAAAGNRGCVVTDRSLPSYGEGYAKAGGGVWVTEYARTGISIWFFPRAQVPSSLTALSNTSTLDTVLLGTPTGSWPSTQCDIDTFFSSQNLIFDITLCGDFAKTPDIFNESCTGDCYLDHVVGSGNNYATAYFEIASVKVFGNDTNSGEPVGDNTSSAEGGSMDGVIEKRWWIIVSLAVIRVLFGF